MCSHTQRAELCLPSSEQTAALCHSEHSPLSPTCPNKNISRRGSAVPCISPSQLVGCKGRATAGSQLEQPVPNSHRGFVGRATHQNTAFLQSASLAVPSAQEKPLPLPWKGQISVFAKDNKFTGKRSRHSRQNLNCSPRILLSPSLCLPLGLPSGDERNCTICLKRNH